MPAIFKMKKNLNLWYQKSKKTNALELLPPAPIEIDSIYHCVLANHHCIAICNGFIFDPILTKGLFLNETHLRKCAQLNPEELSSQMIIRAYKYT